MTSLEFENFKSKELCNEWDLFELTHYQMDLIANNGIPSKSWYESGKSLRMKEAYKKKKDLQKNKA